MKKDCKRKPFNEKCYNCGKTGHRISECKKIKKLNEKAEKAVDETGDIFLCTIINKMVQKEEVKKKVSFTDDIKIKNLHAEFSTSQEVGVVYTINGETISYSQRTYGLVI